MNACTVLSILFKFRTWREDNNDLQFDQIHLPLQQGKLTVSFWLVSDLFQKYPAYQSLWRRYPKLMHVWVVSCVKTDGLMPHTECEWRLIKILNYYYYFALQTNKQINRIEALNKDSLTPSYFIQQQNMFMEKSDRILHRLNIIGRFSINNEEIPRVVCKLGMVQCTPCSPPHPTPLQKTATQKSCPHTQICNSISYAFVRTVS